MRAELSASCLPDCLIALQTRTRLCVPVTPKASYTSCRLRFRERQQVTILELRCRRFAQTLLLPNTPGEASRPRTYALPTTHHHVSL